MSDAQKVKVYYWDFFGPDARGTAEHFRTHLDQFLYANSLAGCATGVMSQYRGHFAAFCKTPAALEETIERSLRPRRAVWGELEAEALLEV